MVRKPHPVQLLGSARPVTTTTSLGPPNQWNDAVSQNWIPQFKKLVVKKGHLLFSRLQLGGLDTRTLSSLLSGEKGERGRVRGERERELEREGEGAAVAEALVAGSLSLWYVFEFCEFCLRILTRASFPDLLGWSADFRTGIWYQLPCFWSHAFSPSDLCFCSSWSLCTGVVECTSEAFVKIGD